MVINMCKEGEQPLHPKVTGTSSNMENKTNLVKTSNFAGFSGLGEKCSLQRQTVVINHSAVCPRGRVQLQVAKHHITQIPQPTPAQTAARTGKKETLYIKLMASSC